MKFISYLLLIITTTLNSMQKTSEAPTSFMQLLPEEIRREIALFAEDAELRDKIDNAILKAGNTPQDILNSYGYTKNEELKNYVKGYPVLVGRVLQKKFTQKDFSSALRTALDSTTVDFDKVKVLILAGANPNTKNLIGQTALEFAILPAKDIKNISPEEYKSNANKRIEFIKLLLSHGADANEFLYGKTTPLYEAVRKKNDELVRILLVAGANVYKKGIFELESALELVRDEEDFPDKNNPIRQMIEEAALKQTP